MKISNYFRVLKFFLLSTVIFLFIFSFSYNLPLDSDLGWHLRYGKETVETRKISNIDTFTYTSVGKVMPRGEWLSEVIFYLLYSKFSLNGLAVGVGLLTSLSFFILIISWSWEWKMKFFLALFAMLGTSNILMMGGRAQNLSWLLFSILLLLLLKFDSKKKIIFVIPIPLIFYLWSFLHPGFWIGFALVGYFLLLQTIELAVSIINKKTLKTWGFIYLFIVFIASYYLVTFTSHGVSYSHSLFDLIKGTSLPLDLAVKNSYTGKIRINILEWFPPIFSDFSGSFYLFGMVFSVATFLLYPKKNLEIKYLFLLLIFIYFSTLARRNMPYFFLVSLPVLGTNLSKSKNVISNKMAGKAISIVFISFFIFVSINRIKSSSKIILASQNDENYHCKIISAPCGAINFIKNNKLKGNIFNEYRWGGYIDWKFPEIPVFIDGRSSGGPYFDLYNKIMTLREGWQDELDKYKVNLILVPPNEIFNELVLSEGNWKKVFSDDYSVVYERVDQKINEKK